ncbi:hypothetical protein HF086_003257 [Spodoptera exigua]|uniref:Uncharacterized protein n=1 Tax=Spodoptera exigua TaxID=7107 RepID=A0A922SFZ0_SPOEX|nr:hypothetical protein HF086_003257 [Spodoptera exigua]
MPENKALSGLCSGITDAYDLFGVPDAVIHRKTLNEIYEETTLNDKKQLILTSDKIFHNRQVGHMLRTKLADADEGGVAAGLGALDSPYLVDM